MAILFKKIEQLILSLRLFILFFKKRQIQYKKFFYNILSVKIIINIHYKILEFLANLPKIILFSS